MSAAVARIDPPDPDAAPERQRTAQVIELWRHQPYRSASGRRAVNGHHADCPMPHAALPEHCSVCQGIRKGGGTW
jgi:hypothetical protein